MKTDLRMSCHTIVIDIQTDTHTHICTMKKYKSETKKKNKLFENNYLRLLPHPYNPKCPIQFNIPIPFV